MRKLAWLALSVIIALPQLALAESFKDVAVVDKNCSAKVASAPDTHTRDCALKCAASGFGIIASDQKFLKFDEAGNKQITEQIKTSSKKDHLRVDVDGTVQGDTLKVSSVKLL